MGEKDIAERYLEDYNDVFADIINVCLFDGREVIVPNDLEISGTVTQYKEENKLRRIERDILKLWKKDNVRVALIGLENQTKAEKYMPLRVIGYDGTAYRNQLNHKQKPCPVVTIVLYFGKSRWNQPKSLKKLFDIPEYWDKYVNDYSLHVVEVSYLTEETIKKFKSDFRYVAEFFVKERLGRDDYEVTEDEIQHKEAFCQLLAVMAKSKEIETLVKAGRTREVTRLCELTARIKAQGIEEGIEQGLKKAYYAGIQDGELSIEYVAKKLGQSAAEIEADMCENGYKVSALV